MAKCWCFLLGHPKGDLSVLNAPDSYDFETQTDTKQHNYLEVVEKTAFKLHREKQGKAEAKFINSLHCPTNFSLSFLFLLAKSGSHIARVGLLGHQIHYQLPKGEMGHFFSPVVAFLAQPHLQYILQVTGAQTEVGGASAHAHTSQPVEALRCLPNGQYTRQRTSGHGGSSGSGSGVDAGGGLHRHMSQPASEIKHWRSCSRRQRICRGRRTTDFFITSQPNRA